MKVLFSLLLFAGALIPVQAKAEEVYINTAKHKGPYKLGSIVPQSEGTRGECPGPFCLSGPRPEYTERVIIGGTTFKRDHRYPALGEAYRDPSGLIWGDTVFTDGEMKPVTQAEAQRICWDMGARLPSEADFRRFNNYLEKNRHGGNIPYLEDGETDVIPHLNLEKNKRTSRVYSHLFWTSTRWEWGAGYFKTYSADWGRFGGSDGDSRDAYVRCVIDGQKSLNNAAVK
jgi:hypothetical protein